MLLISLPRITDTVPISDTSLRQMMYCHHSKLERNKSQFLGLGANVSQPLQSMTVSFMRKEMDRKNRNKQKIHEIRSFLIFNFTSYERPSSLFCRSMNFNVQRHSCKYQA